MNAIVFLIWLATVVPVNATGSLVIRGEPGLRVILDGTFVGMTNLVDKGLSLRSVPVGAHRVTVEKAEHLAKTFEVEVVAGTPLVITLSSAGWKKLGAGPRPKDGGVRFVTDPPECTIVFRGQEYLKRFRELRIDGVPSGIYLFTIRRGEKSFQREIEVRDGLRRVVTIGLPTESVALGEEPYVPRPERRSPNDILRTASLPQSWKNALQRVTTRNASLGDLRPVDGGVAATFILLSDVEMHLLRYNLKSEPMIASFDLTAEVQEGNLFYSTFRIRFHS